MTPRETLLVVWTTLVTSFLLSQYPLARYASSVLEYVGAIFQAYKAAVVSVSGDLPALLHILGVGLNLASFALYLIPLWSFLVKAKSLGALTRDTNRLVRRVANKPSLSHARKIALRLSRKDLHRMTENSLRRRMKHVQTRLDATHSSLSNKKCSTIPLPPQTPDSKHSLMQPLQNGRLRRKQGLKHLQKQGTK